MKRFAIPIITCVLTYYVLVGCRSLNEADMQVSGREALNRYILPAYTFNSTPLIDVLKYVETNINEQSKNVWKVEPYQAVNDPRSLSDDQVENSITFSGTITSHVGVGDFFLYLNEWTNTNYEVDENVIRFSRRVNVHTAEPKRNLDNKAPSDADSGNDPFAPIE